MSDMQYISIIDIWTQSIKHYIFAVAWTQKDIVYYQRYSEANLGNDWDIDEVAIERNINILKQCIQKNSEYGVNKTIAVGTQILRTASNAEKFCQSVKDTFGLEIKILTHQDEALYLYKWLANIVGEDSFGAVNIWWWSTEIVTGTKANLKKDVKIEIGVKTLKTLFASDTSIDRVAMEQYLDNEIQLGDMQENTLFITGVLDFYLTVWPQLGYQFTESTFANHPIVFDLLFMQEFIQTLRSTDVTTLRSMYSKDPWFADNVAIGQTLYRKVAQKLGAKYIYPSKNDLTDGLVVEIQ